MGAAAAMTIEGDDHIIINSTSIDQWTHSLMGVGVIGYQDVKYVPNEGSFHHFVRSCGGRQGG